jgi:hypothetical protein
MNGTLLFATVPESRIKSWDSWFIFNLRKINTCYYMSIHHTYLHGKGFQESHAVWLLHYYVIDLLLGCWPTDNVTTTMVFCYESSWRTVHHLINTYLGYLLLEAPRECVRHGPLVSINWLWLCPQFGPLRPKLRHPQEAIYSLRRRLFIVLMIAAHISPNVISLRNFLSNIHALFLTYIHRHSY